MKERPILFNADMVNAILDSRKTQTRRIINPQPEFKEGTGFHWKSAMYGIGSNYAETVRNFTNFSCPIGRVGDRLWVRETWSTVNLYGEIALAYKADSEVTRVVENESFQDEDGLINYDDPRLEKYSFAVWADDLLDGEDGSWKPSIHMPRWASRILLEITDVRVERLNDISKEDAKAEGFDYSTHPSAIKMGYAIGAKTNFRHAWQKIYGAESWDKNPWVWVVEFRVVGGDE